MLMVLVAVGLLGAASVTTTVLLRPRLPDPEVANREEIIRWLVTRDLGAEPPRIRQVLARRLEEEVAAGLDWNFAAERLSQSRRKRLWNNIMLLLKPWFMDKLDCYSALPVQDQAAFLDRLLDIFKQWQGAESICPQQGKDSSGQAGLVVTLLAEIRQWKAEAKPQRRKQINQFLQAIIERWMQRSQLLLAPKQA